MPSPNLIQRVANTARRRGQRQAQRQKDNALRETAGVRQRVGQLLRATHSHAHSNNAYASSHQEATTKLDQLEDDHPRFADLTIEWATLYWIVFSVIPVVYLADLMLFFQTAVTVSRYAFTNRHWMVTIACYLIPAVFLGIEIGVASQMYAAAHRPVGERGNGSYGKWLGIGILLLVVMPALVVSTHPALAAWNNRDHLSRLLTWQLLGFVALVIVTHFFVIFGGDTAHNAKAYAAFSFSRLRLRRRIRNSEAEAEREARAATDSFGQYLTTLNEYNQLNPNAALSAGPFDVITRELINERHGYEIIEAPRANAATEGSATNRAGRAPVSEDAGAHVTENGSRPRSSSNGNHAAQPPQTVADDSNGNAAQAVPTPTSASDTDRVAGANTDDGETNPVEDYLRTLLTRQVRDAESEVRN